MAPESHAGWRNHPVAVTVFRLSLFVMFLAWVMSICALCTYWTGWDGASGLPSSATSRSLLYRLDLKRLTWCSSIPFCDPFFQEGIELKNLNNAQEMLAASNLCFDVFLVFTLLHAFSAVRLVLLLCAQQQCCDECCGSCCPIMKLDCMKDIHFQIWLRLSCAAYTALTIAGILAVRNYDNTARSVFPRMQLLWYAQATGQAPPPAGNPVGRPNEWAFQDGFNCAVAACVMGVLISGAWLACICLTQSLPGGSTLCGCAQQSEAAIPATSTGASRTPSAPPIGETVPPWNHSGGAESALDMPMTVAQQQMYQQQAQAQRVMMAYGLQNNPLQVINAPSAMYAIPTENGGMAYYPGPMAAPHMASVHGSPHFHPAGLGMQGLPMSAGAHRAQTAMYGSPVHSYMAVPGAGGGMVYTTSAPPSPPLLAGQVAGQGGGYYAYGVQTSSGIPSYGMDPRLSQSLPRSGSANSASWPAQPQQHVSSGTPGLSAAAAGGAGAHGAPSGTESPALQTPKYP